MPATSGRSLRLRRCRESAQYDALFRMIETGKLTPEKLIGRTITLEQSIDALVNMDKFEVAGITEVTKTPKGKIANAIFKVWPGVVLVLLCSHLLSFRQAGPIMSWMESLPALCRASRFFFLYGTTSQNRKLSTSVLLLQTRWRVAQPLTLFKRSLLKLRSCLESRKYEA
jgi:hypothetical protein